MQTGVIARKFLLVDLGAHRSSRPDYVCLSVGVRSSLVYSNQYGVTAAVRVFPALLISVQYSTWRLSQLLFYPKTANVGVIDISSTVTSKLKMSVQTGKMAFVGCHIFCCPIPTALVGVFSHTAPILKPFPLCVPYLNPCVLPHSAVLCSTLKCRSHTLIRESVSYCTPLK